MHTQKDKKDEDKKFSWSLRSPFGTINNRIHDCFDKAGERACLTIGFL
jgi:hypothetical protein